MFHQNNKKEKNNDRAVDFLARSSAFLPGMNTQLSDGKRAIRQLSVDMLVMLCIFFEPEQNEFPAVCCLEGFLLTVLYF